MTIRTSTDATVHWQGTEGAPLVVLLHDWHGRLPWIDSRAHELASDGFRVAVPDLYAGRTTIDDEDAAALRDERLDDSAGAEHAISEVVGEARALGSERVGLVGFSMGATIAVEYASQGSVDAVVAYYGAPRPGIAVPRMPLLFQLAASDQWDGRESPDALSKRAEADGLDTVEIRSYAAEHGFQNNEIARFDADASAEAWASTLAFLREHLVADEH